MLARIAHGELPTEDLEPVVSEAQVATARAEQEEQDRAALARIRGVVDQLDEVLREQEEERQRDEHMGGGQRRRRLGTGSLEAKLIRGFGPYLYFREAGRHRSVHVGKIAPAGS